MDRTITLACSDWKRIRDVLKKQGATTPRFDTLIGEHDDDKRLTLVQSFEWWCAVVSRIQKAEPKLSYRLVVMASCGEPAKPTPKPDKLELKIAKQYMAQDDDSWVP